MKHPLAYRFMASFGTAGALASAVLFMAPLHAQDARLSLADRVTRLEQLAQSRDQTNFKLLNQLQQMQSQIQQQQGQIEVLQHQLQDMQDTSKAQYLDLDSRVGRLEKAAAPASGQPAAASSAPSASASSAPAPAAATVPSKATPAPSRPTAAMQKAYEAAFKDVTSGHYVDASRGFRDYIEKYPVNTLTPNAFYWLGESYYATTNYPIALQAFQHLLQQFPDSEKAPAALLKLGYTQQALKQQPAAEATLKAVVAKYPGTRVAELAKERLHQMAQPPAAR
ncbi:tol-pal system protein YbgF [Dyella sp. A6]|uniref:tol-pal system protein YbgF n=1 Tax=Dyella aluminiiresistens TaxID=3069105 RepID=UPI002E78EC95|nr:tol-pal system protein YbgF [Dyella sp. A6]